MTNEKTGQKLSGILFFVAAILLISIVDTICKIFTTELHSLQLVWGYFLGINLTLWIFFYCRRERITNLIKTDRIVVQLMRPAFLAASITSLFLGLTYLPIAEATTIGFTAPLFITALSGPILREKVGIHRWLAVVLGLVGVLVIVRPGGGLWHWASLMPFVGAIFFAIFQIITRLLSKTEKTNTTLFYTGLGGFFWTSIIVPFVWITPSLLHWIVFLLTGAMGAVAHLCMISAFNRAEASLLAPFNYTKLLWVSVLGFLIFGDVPSFNMWVGATIIVVAGIYILYRERNT